MYIYLETVTEEEIVCRCDRSTAARDVVHELEGGHSVVRISKDAVVKCGFEIYIRGWLRCSSDCAVASPSLRPERWS
ncbi:hypothetical protein K504DRAFT_392029 [Pleomassaria siparia CBS 279.74]|uniref:Uncharacterized protein n=1 Tax=Pleomassaria siparia CBS 279.74 TaxID=1314801 RepID=A0A6G1JTU4_9PLEO|nr:hypothetical protein K504DRAFT_392029 [Pleomassaria siparia CBS 279.74]